MRRILIKNGNLMSKQNGYYGKKQDILIEDGIITQIASHIFTNNAEVYDVQGKIVTAGLIDIHTHVYEGETKYGTNCDVVGHQQGVSTLIDAGSAGINHIDDFKNQTKDSITHVFAFLNVASEGMTINHELDHHDAIDPLKIINKSVNDPFIVGLKARASKSVVGDQGIAPILLAQKIADEINLPLMIHIGNQPPTLEEVLLTANRNTILTHAFHDKDNNILKSDAVIDLLKRRLDRGLKLDIGHGNSSFNYDVFEEARSLGIDYDFISTNHNQSNSNKSGHDLHAIITKIMNLDGRFIDIIDKLTYQPAQYFNLEGYGELKVGAIGNISVCEIREEPKVLKDTDDNALISNFRYLPVLTITSKKKVSYIYDHKI